MSHICKRIHESHDVNIRDVKRMRYTEDGIPVTTLSLSAIGKEVTAPQLYDYFSTFGPVDNIQIKSLGYVMFGFVKFTHAESAAQALSIKSHYFAGHSTTVGIAASRYQVESMTDDLPIELTNVTGSRLVDLNEDCLSKMFSLKYIGLMDLCSVSETCSRLKGVAMAIFRLKHKVWYFNKESVITIDEARRIFLNFGSVLSEIKIDWSRLDTMCLNERTTQIMDLVITYCSKLESLILISCKIDNAMQKRLIPLFNQLVNLYFDDIYMKGHCKELLANCESLVELTVLHSQPLCEKVGENTFPKLTKFKCNDYLMYNWENFILRHKTLKTISLGYTNFHSSLLPIIARNCEQLEKLKIRTCYQEMSTVDYEKALKSLIKLDHLKVLKLHCNLENITKFIQELHLLKSLEFLELLFAEDVFEFIADLSQLKKLKILRLLCCDKAKNLNLLGNLHRLTELDLVFYDSASDSDFDVVDMIESLTNLETLKIQMSGFRMDEKTYLRIVNAVQRRPKIRRTLAISCDKDFILYNDGNRQIVKLL